MECRGDASWNSTALVHWPLYTGLVRSREELPRICLWTLFTVCVFVYWNVITLAKQTCCITHALTTIKTLCDTCDTRDLYSATIPSEHNHSIYTIVKVWDTIGGFAGFLMWCTNLSCCQWCLVVAGETWLTCVGKQSIVCLQNNKPRLLWHTWLTPQTCVTGKSSKHLVSVCVVCVIPLYHTISNSQQTTA